MKTYKYILPILCAGAVVSSCDDMFEPANEMISDIEVMYNDPQFAAGMLGNAYILMPYDGTPHSDLATDDAVSNENSNQYTQMAQGAWSAAKDPMQQWQARNNAINYCNIMLENAEKVTWSGIPSVNQMFIDHMMGDAYGMRAIQRFYLLRAHAGKVNGELTGVILFDEYQTGSTDFEKAMERLPFKECVDRILEDIDKALELLPEDYADIANAGQIPAKYQAIGADMSGYNRAFGAHHHGKVSGQILKAVRAQMLLFAASPAYGAVTWDEAAKAAAEVIGNKEVVPNGHTWYKNVNEIEDVKRTQNTPEAIWMTNPGNSNSLESDNFPPSIYGKGRTNPTQNLVDAFPMADGKPITAAGSGYDPQNPYANRDPRLAEYIVVNGSTMGVHDALILSGIYEDDPTTNGFREDNDDNLGKQLEYSTRTGYYMRKLLRNDVNMDPKTTTQQKHYTARIRWTEIFLAYAEAANEAYGPTQGAPGCSLTPKSVIKAIRERAGICKGTTDSYLEECAQSKDKMRELIRNERRLELCFENQRFYDLRRWNLNLNETTQGMRIEDNGKSFTKFDVDFRRYDDYMIYGPIPDSEVKKFSSLKQNDGWR